MESEGIAADRQRFEFSLDVRHKGQINEVEIAAALDARCPRLRAAAAQAVRAALREALRPRLGARRRAARDRRLPPARQGPHAAAEAGARQEDLGAGIPQGAMRKQARHLLARPEASAARRRCTTANGSLNGNKIDGPGDRRNGGYHGRRPAGNDAARRRARQFRDHLSGEDHGNLHRRNRTAEEEALRRGGGRAVRQLRAAAVQQARRRAAERRAGQRDRQVHVRAHCDKARARPTRRPMAAAAPARRAQAAPRKRRPAAPSRAAPAPARQARAESARASAQKKPAAAAAERHSERRSEFTIGAEDSSIQTRRRMNAPLKKLSELAGVAFDGRAHRLRAAEEAAHLAEAEAAQEGARRTSTR